MKTSKEGIALIKKHEGFSGTAYWDVDGYSIGYGHHGARAGQTVSEEEAESLLRQDVAEAERAVESLGARLSQQQFDAVVSLVYNIGGSRFGRSRTAAMIKADPSPTPELERQWKQWRLAGGKVNAALVRRRADEWRLYASTRPSATVLLGIAAAAVAAGAGLALIIG